MEKQKTHRLRKSDRCGLPALLGWQDQTETLGQRIEGGHSVNELDSLRADLAAALDRMLDLKACDCPVRFPGQLVERQQLPFAVEERARIEGANGLELEQSLVEQSLVAALDEHKLLAGADIVENPVVLKQAAGLNRGRRWGVAGADRSARAVSVFKVFDDEAFLPGIEFRSVPDHAGDLPAGRDFPRLDVVRIVNRRVYHSLAFFTICVHQKKTDPIRQSVYRWIKEWKVERLVDALKLSRASGIPVE